MTDEILYDFNFRDMDQLAEVIKSAVAKLEPEQRVTTRALVGHKQYDGLSEADKNELELRVDHMVDYGGISGLICVELDSRGHCIYLCIFCRC